MSDTSAEDVAARRRAFREFVEPEIEVMLRVARSTTGNPADAEDLVQESLIRAFRAVDRFDGRHPRAWLLTIMRNTNVNLHRRQRPVTVDDWELIHSSRPAFGTPQAPPAEDVYVAEELHEELHAAVSALDPGPGRRARPVVRRGRRRPGRAGRHGHVSPEPGPRPGTEVAHPHVHRPRRTVMSGPIRQMLTCHWSARRIQRYLDSDPAAQLTPGEITRLEAHVATCERCEELVHQHRLLHRAFSLWSGRPVDPASVDRMRTVLDDLTEGRA